MLSKFKETSKKSPTEWTDRQSKNKTFIIFYLLFPWFQFVVLMNWYLYSIQEVYVSLYLL